MTSGALTSMTLKSSIHMCQTHYTQEGVLQAAPAQCADARADLVHGGYLRHARALDARHHAGVRDPDARPIPARHGSGPLFPRKMGPIHPQIVYSDLFDCICDVSYLQYIRCI